VLTNDPPYPAQVANLNSELFRDMTCEDRKGTGVFGSEGSDPGPGDDPEEGSGLLGLPGSSVSSSRFVRANKLAYCASTWQRGPDEADAVQTAFRLIGRNEMLLGEVRSIFGPETTRLTLVRVLRKNGRSLIYFRTEHNQSVRVIDLAKLDFAGLPPLPHPWTLQKDSPDYRKAQDVTPGPDGSAEPDQ
jgi:penicillin V acylase-like amidase (Ntn superfamily)